MAQVLPPNTVSTTLNYHLVPEKGGTDVFYPGKASNYFRKRDPHNVNIIDIRIAQKNETFTLDKQGFELVRYPAFTQNLHDDNVIKAQVYPQIVELLKQATGATHVHPFSHLTRFMPFEEAQEAARGLDPDDYPSFKATARFAHVDQSDPGAQQVLDDNLPADEGAKLSKTRWAIVNVWRPINQTIRREPLAMCDARTVDDSDFRPVMAVLPPRGSGTYENVSKKDSFEALEPVANPRHQWYYASELQPDEALLLKNFDSKRDGRARRTTHTAFVSDDDSGPPRHSIEVRCFVFWEDQTL